MLCLRKLYENKSIFSLVLPFSYSECPKYHGQGFSMGTGHFTQMVWKSCKSFGIYAQTCNIKGSSMKCAVALRMDCAANMQGAFKSNVGNVGQCAKVPKLFPAITSNLTNPGYDNPTYMPF
jgi:hypothetical protein